MVEVDLRTFSAFMSRITGAALEVSAPSSKTRNTKATRSERGKGKNFLNTHLVKDGSNGEQRRKDESLLVLLCLACNGANHKVKECVYFAKWEPERRWKIVEEHRLCRTCLSKHGRRPCKLQKRCGIGGCERRHHPLLHIPKADTMKDEPRVEGPGVGINAHHATEQSTLFRILPVTLHRNGKSVDTFAFLDDGSSMTLVEQAIVKQLDINDGETVPLCLTWTSNVTCGVLTQCTFQIASQWR